MLTHKTIPNLYEYGRSKDYGLDSTRNLTADPGEIYIDVVLAGTHAHFQDYGSIIFLNH